MSVENCLTITEAAELSGYNPEWLRRLCKKGRIKARQADRIWLIDRDSLLAYKDDPPAPGPEPGTFPGTRPQDKDK